MSRFVRRYRPFVAKATPQNIKNLFELIRDEKMVVENLAANWIILYRSNENEALLILVSFLLESMGFEKNLVTSEDLESSDLESLMSSILSHVRDPEDYPIISKAKQFRTFYLNFQHFWIYLMTEAGESLYDGSMLTFTMNWLSSFTFSNFKSARHTSTLAILSSSQALIDILCKEIADLTRVQTFIRTELANPDTQRLEHLQAQEQEINTKQQTLQKELDEFFNDVLRIRCIDSVAEIRSICIQGLTYMTERIPSKFLTADTLKILGFSLFDKSSEVRLKAIEFLLSLTVEENYERLQDFFREHKLRIVEMCHDVESKVCVIAIEICSRICKQGWMEVEEKQVVLCLIWAESDEIRNAACGFLLASVMQEKEGGDDGMAPTIDQGRTFDSEKEILRLVAFHEEFSETELCRIEIVVQTLWGKTTAVKSWEAMCELLKRGERPNTTPLSDTQRKIIIYMLISGLKFIYSSSDKKQKSSMIALTSTLIIQLPSLLKFYTKEHITLSELVKIPIYLDLSALSAKDLRDHFTNLVKVLIELHGIVEDREVIFRISQSLGKLSRESYSLQKEAKNELTKLSHDVCDKLNEQLKKFTLEAEEGLLQKLLLRTEALISVYDTLEDFGLYTVNDIIGILSQYLSNSLSNSEMARSAAGILYFYHLWELNKITKHQESLNKCLENRGPIIELFTAIIAKSDCDSNLKFSIFTYLCETLMVISSQAAVGSPFHYEVSKDIWITIEEYMLSTPIIKSSIQISKSSKAFQKLGAKDDALKEDADETSQILCLLVSRIISFCPSLTTSHLPSSFLAYFGVSKLRSISLIVKQVILHYKTKESQQSGVFNENSLFFSIVLESMIKAMGSGSEEDIAAMKDLVKKFTVVMGNGAMRPKQADKFLAFIIDGISFALSDKDNFQILEGISLFLQKGYLSPNQMKELFDRVSKDADAIEEKIKKIAGGDIQAIIFPIKHFLYTIGKVVGVSRQPPVLASEKTKKQINKKREELYKKAEQGKDEKEKVNDKDTEKSKGISVKKVAFNIFDEYRDEDQVYLPMESIEEDIELPKKRKAAEDEGGIKAIKKSAIRLNTEGASKSVSEINGEYSDRVVSKSVNAVTEEQHEKVLYKKVLLEGDENLRPAVKKMSVALKDIEISEIALPDTELTVNTLPMLKKH